MRKINSRVGICIGLLSLHALSSCTSIKQGIGTNKVKKPLQTMLGAALFSNVMGSPMATNLSSLSNTTTTGLSHSTAMGTTLNPYDLSTTSVFNATEVAPYACKNGSMGIDMLNAKHGPYGTTPLMDAAADGRIEDIKCLIGSGADLSAKDVQGRTALMYAIVNNKIDVVKLLTESTADLNIRLLNVGDNQGITPLMQAIISNNVPAIKYLLDQKGVDLDAEDYSGQTALVYLVISNLSESVNFVNSLISKQVRVNAQDYSGKTPLMHLLISDNQIDNKKRLVDLLINKGANLNIQDNSGKTPLMHLLISDTHIDDKKHFVHLLINNVRTHLDTQDCSGKTPLMYAAIHRRIESIFVLQGKGVKLHIQDHEGITFLMHGIVNIPDQDVTFITELFGKNGFNLEAKDHEGKTALMYAAIHGKLKHAKTLIEKQADVHAKDHKGKTAYAHAVHSGNFDIANLLKENGANPNG